MTKRVGLRAGTSFFLCLLMALFSGCALQVKLTGGGKIPSQDGVATDNAVFNVSGDNCGTTANLEACEFPAAGHVNYKDPTATTYADNGGVAFHGDISEIDPCVSDLPSFSCLESEACAACFNEFPEFIVGYASAVSYTSTNTDFAGSGNAYVCLISPGQGPNNASAEDLVGIVVTSGPYGGYTNEGAILHGNINSINCPASQAAPLPTPLP